MREHIEHSCRNVVRGRHHYKLLGASAIVTIARYHEAASSMGNIILYTMSCISPSQLPNEHVQCSITIFTLILICEVCNLLRPLSNIVNRVNKHMCS